MTVRLVWILFLFLSFRWASAQGPYYVFRDITTGDGLSSGHVNSIIQDDKGFIWISTDNGLQRYDGYSFTTYHHRPFDPNSLSSDATGELLEDRDKNIWTINALWGFNIVHPSTGVVGKINDPEQKAYGSLNNSSSICQDDVGNIWLLALNSLAMYDIRQHRLVSYYQALPPGENMSFTRNIQWDPRLHGLWMNSSRYGVCYFDPSKKAFYYQKNNPEHLPAVALREGVGMLFLDGQDCLWVNTYTGKLFCCLLSTGQWTEYFSDGQILLRERPAKPKEVFVNNMLQSRSGAIWIALRDVGLIRYDHASTVFEKVQSYPGQGESPGNYQVGCLFEDREGNIWMSRDGGIRIFNPSRQQFVSVPLMSTAGKATPEYVVQNFLETRRGDIWVATMGGGIYVYDQQFRLKKIYDHPPFGKDLSRAPAEPENRIWCLLERPDGTICVGCQHGWLTVYDPVTDRFTSRQPADLDQRTIIRMIASGEQTVWMNLYDGFARWDMDRDEFVHYKDFIPFRGTTAAESAALLITDSGHTLWIGTLDHGLQEFDVPSGRFARMYVPVQGDVHGVSSVSIQNIIALDDSLLALATYDGGIDLFNRRTGWVSAITTADGLPSNSVSAIWFRAPGQLWAATPAGLCKVDLATRRVTQYGAEDGVASKEFGDLLGFYRLRDGRVLAGYRGGFVSFHPDSLGAGVLPADVQITGVGVFERPLLLDSALRGSDSLFFSYRQNFITIQYASLSYRGSGNIQYYYRLEGIDKDWVDAGARRYASFTNLPSGSYVFKVKCEDREGNFSKETAMVIMISAPFWEEWWFYTLDAVCVVCAAYVFYRYRLKQELRVAAIRNKISRDLHDDLGATLSSITVLSEIARARIEEGNPEQSFPLLGKIRSYSGEMVGKMRDIVWAIDPRNDTLESMIQRLRQYTAEWCANHEIHLRFTVANEFLQTVPPMNTRKNLYLICKEAIYNAIRHSGATKIVVHCRMDDAIGEVVISDDGRGFDPGRRYGGNGVDNMRSRAGEIGARLSIHSDTAGTTVRIRLAVPKIRD